MVLSNIFLIKLCSLTDPLDENQLVQTYFIWRNAVMFTFKNFFFQFLSSLSFSLSMWKLWYFLTFLFSSFFLLFSLHPYHRTENSFYLSFMPTVHWSIYRTYIGLENPTITSVCALIWWNVSPSYLCTELWLYSQYCILQPLFFHWRKSHTKGNANWLKADWTDMIFLHNSCIVSTQFIACLIGWFYIHFLKTLKIQTLIKFQWWHSKSLLKIW